MLLNKSAEPTRAYEDNMQEKDIPDVGSAIKKDVEIKDTFRDVKISENIVLPKDPPVTKNMQTSFTVTSSFAKIDDNDVSRGWEIRTTSKVEETRESKREMLGTDFAIANFESHFEGTKLVGDEHSHCCSCVIV